VNRQCRRTDRLVPDFACWAEIDPRESGLIGGHAGQKPIGPIGVRLYQKRNQLLLHLKAQISAQITLYASFLCQQKLTDRGVLGW
jgi:hypothetical protein